MNSPAPTCATCGYSLHGLTEFRCPECGSPFTKEDLERAATIQLSWNRHDKPLLVRLIKTILLAWFKPHVYFSTAAKSPTRPLSKPGRFILACVGLSIGMHMSAIVLERVCLAARFIASGVSVPVVIQILGGKYDLDIWSMYDPLIPVGVILQVITIASVMWLFRERRYSITIRSLIALLMPVLALQSLPFIVYGPLIAISWPHLELNETLFYIAHSSTYLSWFFLVIVCWLCGRKILQWSRIRSFGVILLTMPITVASDHVWSQVYYQILVASWRYNRG